jgi:hypothetical protein
MFYLDIFQQLKCSSKKTLNLIICELHLILLELLNLQRMNFDQHVAGISNTANMYSSSVVRILKKST